LRLRLGEFYPRAAFIGGRRYDLSRAEPVRGGKMRFPYNSYYKFRIKVRGPYDAALFSKMPIACWQEKHRAFAVVFPKFLTLPQGRLPVFIRATGAEAVVDFTAAILSEFRVERKPVGWFSTRVEHTKHSVILPEAQSFETTFLLVAADTWVECVQACVKHLYETRQHSAELSAESLARMLSAAIHFYDRVWDSRNRTHVHLPVKNVPGFESVEFKHSHITDDIAKLVLYRRLVRMGCAELAQRERALLTNLVDGPYRYELDGTQLWHTTTYFNGNELEAFTHHGAGFVGFPGGMATIVRRLFEYCSLERNEALDQLAKSGADWLARTQGEDGSWPALIESTRGRAYIGCIASTAEAVRALTAAYLPTERQEYRAAAEAGIRFINRDESFFECRRYLRDVDPDEADGISAEACIHANLDWHGLTRDDRILAQAGKWGWYALQWVRPRSLEYRAEPSFDGLSQSITPRIDVWGSLLIAGAFMKLSHRTGDESWREHAWRLFENIAGLQERDGGLCETWFLDFPSGLESIHIEPTFVTDAFVEFILDAYRDDDENPLAKALSRQRDPMRQKRPPLDPSGAPSDLVTIARDRPEFVIDQRLRLILAFDGAYGSLNGTIQAVYTMLREVGLGRQLLKLVPIAKILLNRHGLSLPPSRIGRAAFINVLSFAAQDTGGGLRTHLYRTPFHNLALSVVSAGKDSNSSPAADIEFVAETIVGDVRTEQVRVDLQGHYEIRSILGKDEFVISSGGNEYSVQMIEGAVDAIIREGDRLALDISLSSNWSFFGQYRLRLRVARSRVAHRP
ncbi:MAG: hypothetical protein JSV16_10260, partial [Candidatus Hydrogenedentota bacterium]